MLESVVPASASIGTRVSWGAILAGSFIALALSFLLGTLGAAVGLSMSQHLQSTTIINGSVVWILLTAVLTLFIGGMVTSLLTLGESKTEAVVHGILMWSVVVGLLFIMGSQGVKSVYSMNYNTMDKAGTTRLGGMELDPAASPTVSDEQAKRLAWYTFACTWLSMLAASAGAYLGAGPTFRVVIVQRKLAVT